VIPIAFEKVTFKYEENPVITSLSLQIPEGVTSLTGPNGAGKSTFLLLASGRILPETGSVSLCGRDTKLLEANERERLCSLVFQNMEFETEEQLGSLLDFVCEHGFLGAQALTLQKEVIQTFGLSRLLSRRTQTLSKGEMQRAVMAFSLLYGSRLIAMDEPVFALEQHQKKNALGFLCEYSRSSGISVVYSAHELDLTRSYSDQVLLFFKEGSVMLGSAEELLRPPILEAAYHYPYALLHQKEELHRDSLVRIPTEREVWEKNQNKKNEEP